MFIRYLKTAKGNIRATCGSGHKKASSAVTVTDDGGWRLCEEEAGNEYILCCFFLPEEATAKSEAGPDFKWTCDLLFEQGIKGVSLNPRKTKAIAPARVKTGRLDAAILSRLLRTDFLPEA